LLPQPHREAFSTAMRDFASSRRESRILIGVFFAALVLHFFLATFNWKTPFMPRHEFRQAQTAIISYYIDQQNDFSLLYETPIVGKPWVSILLEVPVYEWSVVWLSRAAGVPHFMAARTITLLCFYLTLPALYLLLGRLELPRPRRLLILALILTCPVYIFYSRAFLIDSMVLMCCAWFLVGFVRAMDDRRWSWLVLTSVAGTGAALIKSATFAVWLLPAAGYGAWVLWRDLRPWRGFLLPLKTVLWGLATIIVALGALRWWIDLTDPIKASHASAWIFTAKNLSQGNWGLLDFGARFSSKVWGVLEERWEEAIMSRWIITFGLLLGLLAFRSQRGRVAGLASVFFLAQLMFPFAYAYQDYYYYACAIFLLAAVGVILFGVLDSRLPRWACGLIIATPLVAQLTTYWQGYLHDQRLVSNGGFNYTLALSEISPPKSVIIVAGADWAAMVPLYSQRKALMIRNGLEFDDAYLKRAFDDLADEDVSALILVGPQRYNGKLLNLAAAHFNLDPSAPTFSQTYTDVYFSRPYIETVHVRLRSSLRYPELTFKEEKSAAQSLDVPFSVTPGMARTSFSTVSPAPFRARFRFGIDQVEIDGRIALSAHPDSDVWVRPPAGAKQITWDFGLLPDAYLRKGDRSDGVEFIVSGETPDGNKRQIFRRVLNPTDVAADRGLQHESISYQPLPDEVLIFSDRPNSGYAYDWTYWARIEVK
jgi:Dolichyl-phosphate-mannose-protein mannosyltransferase